jgi:hypothetical protein
MTIIEKVKFLKEERYQDLNPWSKEFITDIYDNAQDDDELTRRQTEKIEEIWMDLGL